MDKAVDDPVLPPTKKALKKARAKARKKYTQAIDDMFSAIANADLNQLRRALDAGARPTELDSQGQSTLHLVLDLVPHEPCACGTTLSRSMQHMSISPSPHTQCEHCFDHDCSDDGGSDDMSYDNNCEHDSCDDFCCHGEDNDCSGSSSASLERAELLWVRETSEKVIVDMIQLLLEWGADPNSKSEEGSTVLYRAIQIVDQIPNYKLTSRFLCLLFSYGATWNYYAGKKSKFDPFLLALKNENDQALQLFIEHGYQLDKCQINMGPSHMWLFFLQMNTFELLARAGVINVLARDNFGSTALRAMVGNNHHISVDQVKTALELGAKLNDSNEDELSVMHLASYKRGRDDDAYSELLRFLVDRGGNLFRSYGPTLPTPMAFVLRDGDSNLIQWCINRALDRGITMDKLNAIGPLSQAIFNKKEGILEKLIRQGFIIDQIDPFSNMTALHIAVQHDLRAPKAKILLEWGANVNCINSLAETPLHISCREGSETCAELLLLYQADINRKTHHDELALELALSSEHNREKIVQCIIRQIVLEESQDHLVEEQQKLLIETEFSDYYSECQIEILRARSSYFDGPHTHYDLLINQSLVKLIGHEVLCKALFGNDLLTKFPIYGKRMRSRLIIAREESIFNEKVRKGLDRIFGSNHDSFHPVYDRIMHYLFRKDLYNLANY